MSIQPLEEIEYCPLRTTSYTIGSSNETTRGDVVVFDNTHSDKKTKSDKYSFNINTDLPSIPKVSHDKWERASLDSKVTAIAVYPTLLKHAPKSGHSVGVEIDIPKPPKINEKAWENADTKAKTLGMILYPWAWAHNIKKETSIKPYYK